MLARALALILALALAAPAAGREHRSGAARREFVAAHPCPGVAGPRGTCPGWIVDHIIPLCAKGADAPFNMQWQTRRAAALKDRDERRMCGVYFDGDRWRRR